MTSAFDHELAGGYGLGTRDYFAVQHGAAFGPSKEVPIAVLADALARTHHASGWVPLILSGPGEAARGAALSAALPTPHVSTHANPPPVGALKALLAGARVLLTTDSGPRHIAEALNVPTVALLGPTDPAWSEHSRATVLRQVDLDCLGCHARSCPLDHHACMETWDPEQLGRGAYRRRPHAARTLATMTPPAASETATPAGSRPTDPAALAREIAEIGAEMRTRLATRIVGLDGVVEQVLITVLTRSHALLEGVPGLAKTMLLSSVSELLDLDFSRVQFTPDLMPSDVTGSEYLVHDVDTGERAFRFAKGPIFANLVLADEINRAPPKTQAALMEAMEERQVTSLGTSRALDDPFVVLATQNPIEQEGTYPLPVAQLDRFLFKVHLGYPTHREEARIARLLTRGLPAPLAPVLDKARFRRLADGLASLPVDRAVLAHAVRLAQATRPQAEGAPETMKEYVAWGAGPRAAQALIAAGRARACLHGRPDATIEDIRAIAPAVLRHRLVLTYTAEADGLGAEAVLDALLEAVPAPGASPQRPTTPWWLRTWQRFTRPPQTRRIA